MLWAPGSIRLLTSGNAVVAGVWPRTAAAALELVGQGPVVAVMGTLRTGVRAVDIDLAGDLAVLARDSVLAWAAAHDYSTLVRPSGRPGHAHVLIAGVPPRDLDDTLDVFCEQVRAELGGLPTARIDPRPSGTLRTLTSPHRHGHPCGPVTGDIEGFLARAEVAHAAHDAATPTTTPRHRTRTGVAADEALTPRPRPRRALRPHLTTWLTTGQEWPLGGHDDSRSTREAIVTAEMVRAGWSHAHAWEAIVTAHPDTMTRARGNPIRWTRHVWNPAVEDNAGHAVDETPLEDDLIDDLASARVRLDVAAARLGPRARPAVLLVGDAVLALMARRRARRVGVAQRLLHEDLDLACPTIGTALHWLDAAGVIVLDRDVLDRRPSLRAVTSYEAVLPPRSHDEIPAAVRGVWENSAPSSHTPRPATGLPRGAHQVLRALAVTGPLLVEDVAVAALLTRGPSASVSEQRTTTTVLRALNRLELVTVDVDGTWTLTHALAPLAHRQTVARARAGRVAAVAAERAAYRAGGASEWSIARAAAIKRQAAIEQAWWDGLSPTERTDRRAHRQMAYAGLPLRDQLALKHELATRRHRRGIDEATHLRAWLASWDDAQLADRRALHAAAFRQRSGPERAATVAAWDLHRARWHLPRHLEVPTTIDAEHAQALPHPARRRDETFLDAQLPLPVPLARSS